MKQLNTTLKKERVLKDNSQINFSFFACELCEHVISVIRLVIMEYLTGVVQKEQVSHDKKSGQNHTCTTVKVLCTVTSWYIPE